MAITKIHPIKFSTLSAIMYITNPEKTDGKLLVSSFMCQPDTADMEFDLTAKLGKELGSVKAQHLIQSFAPGEVDEKTAHEIGMKLASRLTEGKHQYVLATHIDHDHVHNHIVFNQVDFMEHKKFRGNKVCVRIMQRINDDLCKEYGLSVIEEKKDKGKSYYEWQKVRESKTAKRILIRNIDLCISLSDDFEHFLKNMTKLGYEIKNTGTYYSFRLPDQKKFKRLKSLGDDYTEEAIRNRISLRKTGGMSIPSSSANHSLLLSGLTQNLSGKSTAYKNKVAASDARKLAATYKFLSDNNMLSMKKLEDKILSIRQDNKIVRSKIKEIDSKLENFSMAKEYLERMYRFDGIYKKYQALGKDQSFYDRHRSSIVLYENALKNLKDFENGSNLSKEEIEKSIESLLLEKQTLKNEIDVGLAALSEISVHYKNACYLFEKNPDLVLSDESVLDSFSDEMDVKKKKDTSKTRGN